MRLPDADKYVFDAYAIERECYCLLAYFLASPAIHRMAAEKPQKQLRLLPLSERWQIKHTLISIAIKLRMIDDLMQSHGRKNYMPGNPVVHVARDGDEKADNIREACNRIIHATSLEYVRDSHTRALETDIVLRGDGSNGNWEATLHIPLFVEAACQMCLVYDEDWDVSGYAEP